MRMRRRNGDLEILPAHGHELIGVMLATKFSGSGFFEGRIKGYDDMRDAYQVCLRPANVLRITSDFNTRGPLVLDRQFFHPEIPSRQVEYEGGYQRDLKIDKVVKGITDMKQVRAKKKGFELGEQYGAAAKIGPNYDRAPPPERRGSMACSSKPSPGEETMASPPLIGLDAEVAAGSIVNQILNTPKGRTSAEGAQKARESGSYLSPSPGSSTQASPAAAVSHAQRQGVGLGGNTDQAPGSAADAPSPSSPSPCKSSGPSPFKQELASSQASISKASVLCTRPSPYPPPQRPTSRSSMLSLSRMLWTGPVSTSHRPIFLLSIAAY